jgi:hypothetical protein
MDNFVLKPYMNLIVITERRVIILLSHLHVADLILNEIIKFCCVSQVRVMMSNASLTLVLLMILQNNLTQLTSGSLNC